MGMRHMRDGFRSFLCVIGEQGQLFGESLYPDRQATQRTQNAKLSQ